MSVKFNEVLGEIQTRLHAPKSQNNDFGHYKYRNLEDIMEAVKPLLKELKATITLSDEMVMLGDRFYVKATATLISAGNELESVTAYARESISKKGMDDAQITGSASSYARKYALNGLLAIDDTKDADSKNNAVEDKKQGSQKVSFTAPNGTSPRVDTKKESPVVFSIKKELCSREKYIDAITKAAEKHGIELSDIVQVTEVNKDFADMTDSEVMLCGQAIAKAIKSIKKEAK